MKPAKLTLMITFLGLVWALSVSHVQANFAPSTHQTIAPNQHPGLQNNRPKSANKSLAVNNNQQAIQRVQRQYKGKVLRVQSSGNSYKVKMLSGDGRVFYVTVDARTGSVRRN